MAYCVVVTENDPMALEFLLDMLEIWGYSAKGFQSGKEAASYCQDSANPLHLLITDLHLDEELNGLELIGLVRNLRKSSELPAIILTGDIRFNPDHQPLASVQKLLKPYRPEILKQRIAKLIESPLQ